MGKVLSQEVIDFANDCISKNLSVSGGIKLLAQAWDEVLEDKVKFDNGDFIKSIEALKL